MSEFRITPKLMAQRMGCHLPPIERFPRTFRMGFENPFHAIQRGDELLEFVLRVRQRGIFLDQRVTARQNQPNSAICASVTPSLAKSFRRSAKKP